MNIVRTMLAGLVLVSLTALGANAHVVPPGSGHYQGAGAIVASFAPFTVVDNGAVVCEDTDGDGIPDHGKGGVCIPFSTFDGNAVFVDDAAYGYKVAFQVCVDANGDGICGQDNTTGAPPTSSCFDLIVYSHASDGSFHNPLFVGTWMEDYWDNCGQKGFPGYIVITCAGVHHDGFGPGAFQAPHEHLVTEGFVTGAYATNTGRGDYCGAPTAVKAYVVV